MYKANVVFPIKPLHLERFCWYVCNALKVTAKAVYLELWKYIPLPFSGVLSRSYHPGGLVIISVSEYFSQMKKKKNQFCN